MLTNQADAPRAINADQQLVYPPADVARRLGISGAGLRRLAQGYERVFNPLPRGPKHGRLWPESAVRQMETARAMVGAGKATSVEAALDTLAHDNPTVNALDVRNAYGDEYEASWEVLVQVLRALRVKLEHQQLRLASLETDVRVLRARSPSPGPPGGQGIGCAECFAGGSPRRNCAIAMRSQRFRCSRQFCPGFHRQSRTEMAVADHGGYVNMFLMSSTQDPPIHWDSHKSKLNVTIILAMIISLFGLISWNPSLLILGPGVGAYSWLTTARHYYIYRDALIIVYGRPRWKAIPFNRVSHIELLSLPIGDRLRVQVVGGKPIILAARDSETFRDRLDTALEKFRTAHPEEEQGDDRHQANPPY